MKDFIIGRASLSLAHIRRACWGGTTTAGWRNTDQRDCTKTATSNTSKFTQIINRRQLNQICPTWQQGQNKRAGGDWRADNTQVVWEEGQTRNGPGISSITGEGPVKSQGSPHLVLWNRYKCGRISHAIYLFNGILVYGFLTREGGFHPAR